MFVSVLRRNHYQILGLGYRATQADIKAAFRELAKKHHPDQNPGDPNAENHFMKIKKSYDCLSDKVKRAEYDREWVQTGRVRWDRDPTSDQSSSTSSEDVDSATSGTMSMKQLIAVYGFVIVLPFIASKVRPTGPESSSSSLTRTATTASSWTSTPPIPEASVLDELVYAYFNPMNGRWEALAEGELPPTPFSLFQQTMKQRPGVYKSMISSETKRLPIPTADEEFAVHMVPSKIVYRNS